MTPFDVDLEPAVVILVYEVPAIDKNSISPTMQVLTQSEKLLSQVFLFFFISWSSLLLQGLSWTE